MQSYKIFDYIDHLTETYKEPIQRVDGLKRDPKEIIRTVEFYSNNQYLSGPTDELDREKPFYNVGNYRVTVAKVATDLDVKDLRYEPDILKHSVQAMLINHELFKYLKETNFSLTLNQMGLTRPKYGGVLVKKHEANGKLEIGVVDWVNVDFDPGDVLGGALIEHHYLQPSEVAAKSDVWYDVDEVLKLHSEKNKGKPRKIHVKQITGEFPVTYYKECTEENYVGTQKDQRTYGRFCFYIACIGPKKVLVYYEKDKKENYKYLPWEKVGNSLGRGVWEDGFEAQIATNDAVIMGKHAFNLTGKVFIQTDSQKVSGNAITGVDTGHIFELEKGAQMSVLNLGPSKLPEIQNVIEMWNSQYDRVASTYDANTGEAPTAGTPYSQTALLNQVANSPFEYRREEWGIFLNEILNDWILPHLKTKILGEHYLTSEFDSEELDLIDEAIVNFDSNKEVKRRMLDSGITPEEQAGMMESMRAELRKSGAKREIKIPEKFLDVEGKITANITGELKNKAAILQSLDSIFKTVIATFNPNTGQYAALQDPTLAKLFGQIVELSGVPFGSAQLRPKATTSADLSAIMPKPNGNPVATV